MPGVAQKTIEDCIKGKRQAQKDLYHQYCDAMFNICLRICKNRTDAEDMLQQSFIDVFRKLDQYRFEASLGAWIKRIVINNCLSFLRSKKETYELKDYMDHADYQDNVDDQQINYTVESVKEGIAQLPEGYRLVLTMYLIEGLTHAEIGEYLQISEATSKSQYHRGKKKLVEHLKEKNL